MEAAPVHAHWSAQATGPSPQNVMGRSLQMLPQGVCVGQGDRGMHRRLAQSLLLRTPEVTAVCCA